MILRFHLLVVLCLMPSTTCGAPPTLKGMIPIGLQVGQSRTITLKGEFPTWPVKVWLSDKAVTAKVEKAKGQVTFTVAKKIERPECWYRVYNDEGASDTQLILLSDNPETDEVEPNDRIPQAQPLPEALVVNGILSRSEDVDCYSVLAKANKTLVVSVLANRILKSPVDAILQLTDAQGNLLAQNHDHRGLDPQLTYLPEKDRQVFIRVFGFPSTPNSTIRYFGSADCHYRLSVSQFAVLDYLTPLAVQAEQEQMVQLHGWNLTTTKVKLSRSDNYLSTKSLMQLAPIARANHPCYDATIETIDKALSPPFSLTGRIRKPAENQQYRLMAKKGQKLQVEVQSMTYGLELMPVVQIRDNAEKVRANFDAELDGTLKKEFTPNADGEYTLVVKDLFEKGGPRHVYRLSVMPLTPTIAPTLETNHWVLEAGKTHEIFVQINRQTDFDHDIVWKAPGLPDNWEIIPVKAAEEKAVVKSTIRLKIPANVTWSGPFEFQATFQDQGLIIAPAQTLQNDFQHPHCWLTVVPKLPAKKATGDQLPSR